MKLLMLGGTGFVGRAVVEDALARGWEVTVLNRGLRPPVEGVRELHGDRTEEGGPEALRAGEWDLVVDTWSSAPTAVRDAARLLAGRAGQYAYISSGSVYRFPPPAGNDERGPVVDASPDDGATDYRQDKRGGELAAQREFGADRTLLVRAGLILGPYEDVGRLPWWLNRIDRGGPVLAPGPRDLGIQYIDARDLARWTLDALVAGLHGPYNTISRPGHATMGELLAECVAATGSDAELRWADPAVIEAAGIEGWTGLPVWLPPGEVYDAMHRGDVSRAHAAGLVCRPVAETVRDTWAWLRSLGGDAPHRADRAAKGISPAQEAAALRALGA
ncbi:reductase [Streptomyces sp. RKND-216]|uniref:NAD-dependent epimerase/dehydratase family protein n=1 Tax=Streptomyces sp. RKND-216 TaxID=2562581 RepID=UPI00109DEDD6|nr:NAD-dependent epimerase/dehydratase family protein [Streptomyces sp. RKND-216]THA23872.1 reductase [Streptomyces sp. RKND-216]